MRRLRARREAAVPDTFLKKVMMLMLAFSASPSRGGAWPPRAVCGRTEAAKEEEEATARRGHILSWASSLSSVYGMRQ
jgi:uncharacterized OB-fold protein